MRVIAPGVFDTIVPGIMEAGSFDGTPMQLRQAVLDQIVTYPETHDQRNWVGDCGTTACVAGWALLFQRGYIPIGSPWDVMEEAMELLDLAPYDAMRLFHYTTEEQARLALKFLVNGEQIPWDEVGHRMPHRSEQLVHDMVTLDVSKFVSERIQ